MTNGAVRRCTGADPVEARPVGQQAINPQCDDCQRWHAMQADRQIPARELSTGRVVQWGPRLVAGEVCPDRLARLYHVHVTNDATQRTARMTAYPATHEEACTIMGKITKGAGRRVHLVEVQEGGAA